MHIVGLGLYIQKAIWKGIIFHLASVQPFLKIWLSQIITMLAILSVLLVDGVNKLLVMILRVDFQSVFHFAKCYSTPLNPLLEKWPTTCPIFAESWENRQICIRMLMEFRICSYELYRRTKWRINITNPQFLINNSLKLLTSRTQIEMQVTALFKDHTPL